MPSSPPYLDVDALLSPLPGSNPAGPVPYTERAELEEARKEKEDPEAVGTFLKPDWARIAQQAATVLQEKSKDLGVAARLTEALFRQHGFAALPEGLRLLRRLIAECWDRLNPPIDEDGDMVARGSALGWLCTPSRGACFPSTVRLHPLFHGRECGYSLIDWQHAQEGRDTIDKQDLNKAIDRLPLADCERLAGDIARSIDDLAQTTQAVQDKMGAEAPDTGELRSALQGVLQLVRQVLGKKRPPEPVTSNGAPSSEQDTATLAASLGLSTRAPATRAEVYRQLAQAATVLRALEPHSPIPYLIQRAVDLGAKPFPEMIRELIREPNTLAELCREFGLGGEGADGQEGTAVESS
jgi:type VI secretion system protein ImpA